MLYCITCGKELLADDIGAYKKFINRGSESFECKLCLSKTLKIELEALNESIEFFKKQGCELFK